MDNGPSGMGIVILHSSDVCFINSLIATSGTGNGRLAHIPWDPVKEDIIQ